jgi:cyclophilin family peptidyl-prolyl cis-trans isomerase
MGLLNPFLYQNADAFTDVLLGSNKVGRGGQPLPYGFNCSAGWDPATGLGTPKFDKLLAAAMGAGPASGQLSASSSHHYTRISKQKPLSSSAFMVMERVASLEVCYTKCDTLVDGSKLGACAGFSLLNVTGVYLCAYYHSLAGLAPPNPPEKDLVAFYEKGAPGPAPPAPPLPPPPPAPTPPPAPPRAPDNFLCTLMTDVGSGEPIVLNVTRANAPNGVDHFHLLAKIGFFNNSAFIRYDTDFLVQWGVSGNSTLDSEYGHTPIPDDPVLLSNTVGTVSFAQSPEKLRATELFINFKNNSHLDAEGFSAFATVVGRGVKTAMAVHNPTPNSTAGVSAQAYADNGNDWIRKTYPGINFITGVVLSA